LQITRRADYAVRTVLDVAGLRPGDVALTSEVAERQRIPAPFLAKIVLALTRAGILRSFRGSGGGIALAKPPDQITLLQVVEAVDGPLAMNRCVLWPDECERSDACPVHDVWCEARTLLAEHLGAISLAALVEDRRGDVLDTG
jgi:Rrf2 family iron-sulfur cluster assembly transcriptional regulator